MAELKNRYDFVLLFDVKDGNPNGDPDAGNLPRLDPETGEGLVTDVCLKRKVRNYVELVKQGKKGLGVFVREKAILNQQIREAYESLGIDLDKTPAKKEDGAKRKSAGEAQGSEVNDGRRYMCQNYYDVRAFGAVMTTGANAGQVRGPIQLTFARSVGQVVPLEHSLTVCAARKEEEPIESQIGIQGRKYTIPYGLYRCHGFISAPLAAQTGFSEDDLNLFWDALKNMFEHDRSAARGEMNVRKLVVFKHDSAYGNAPAHALFSRLTVTPTATPPRAYTDFDVALDKKSLPSGVAIEEKV